MRNPGREFLASQKSICCFHSDNDRGNGDLNERAENIPKKKIRLPPSCECGMMAPGELVRVGVNVNGLGKENKSPFRSPSVWEKGAL